MQGDDSPLMKWVQRTVQSFTPFTNEIVVSGVSLVCGYLCFAGILRNESQPSQLQLYVLQDRYTYVCMSYIGFLMVLVTTGQR